MMNSQTRRPEGMTRVAPLGVRFWDEVSHRIIAEGLIATSYPAGNPVRRTQGVPNRSGTYVFQNLPGLADIERGAGDEEFWDSVIYTPPFVVEVMDSEKRFQPFRLAVDLPVQGLFDLEHLLDSPPHTGSPPSAGTAGILLHSSPTRTVPGGMAVLRASLAVPARAGGTTEDTPAAWAMLEASIAGQSPVRGFADDQGRIALIFPYPEPVDFVAFPETGDSPPLASGSRLTRQVWPVQLRAFYTPLPSAPQTSGVPAAEPQEFPDLLAVLKQVPAQLWKDAGQTQPLPEQHLEFGRELIVRSYDSGEGRWLPKLFVTPLP